MGKRPRVEVDIAQRHANLSLRQIQRLDDDFRQYYDVEASTESAASLSSAQRDLNRFTNVDTPAGQLMHRVPVARNDGGADFQWLVVNPFALLYERWP